MRIIYVRITCHVLSLYVVHGRMTNDRAVTHIHLMLATAAKRLLLRLILFPRYTIRPTLYLQIVRSNLTLTRSLKASAFAFPKNEDAPQKSPSSSDFDTTKLIHGKSDLEIALTERATQKLCQIAQDDKNPKAALRIIVESGGCHGFQYNLKLTTVDEAVAETPDILIFQRKNGDSAANLAIDESSLEILQESKIDYTKELIGSSFKVVESPYTSTECGCGASFDFDFDKLEKKKKKGQA